MNGLLPYGNLRSYAMIDAISLANKFVKGVYVCDVDPATWRLAFAHLARYRATLVFDRPAVHLAWTVNAGHLRNKIRDDSLIVRVLEFALPKYQGDDMLLYRGECKDLFDRGLIGFCWTPHRAVAECFARGLNALESGGVLLRSRIPAEAILAGPHAHSSDYLRETEYTCDPAKIVTIDVLQHFPKA